MTAQPCKNKSVARRTASTEKDGTVAALNRTSRKIYERFIKGAMTYGTVWRGTEGCQAILFEREEHP